MLSYLDLRWLLVMEGAGMHKMGRKLTTFLSIRDGASQTDRLGRLAIMVLRTPKDIMGVACMKGRAEKTLYLGLLSIERALVGA